MKPLALTLFLFLSGCSAASPTESKAGEIPSPTNTVVLETATPTPLPTPQLISRALGWTVIAEQENGIWDIYLRSSDGSETLKTGLSSFDPAYPAWYSIQSEETFFFKSLADGNQYIAETTCISLEEGCAPHVEIYKELDPPPLPTSTFTPEPSPTAIPENSNTGWIVFSAWTSDALETRDLYLLSPDGTEVKDLGLAVYDPRQPAWAFDGQKIAFVGDRNIYEVYVGCVDLAEGCHPYVKRLTTSKWDDRYLFPSWSPDGTQLALIYEEPNRTFDRPRQLGILDLGTNELQLFSGYGWKPQWDIRQDSVALLDIGKEANLVLNALDGTDVQPLLMGKAIDQEWAWSPDRTKILYLSGSDIDPEVFLYDIETKETTMIAFGSDPAWAPTGDRIAYSADGGIYLHDLESGIRIFVYEASVFEMAWAP